MGEILIRDLSKVYDAPGKKRFEAVSGVSFALKKGECLSLIGESGSGKSTIARLLIGLEPPTSGSILMDGEEMTAWDRKEWRRHRARIQAVFQDSTGTLNPRLSVRSNAQIALKNLTDMNAEQRRERILELMDMMRLNQRLLKTPTSALSGGEQRRVALLRALSIHPDYIVLDEMTSGLDLVNTGRVLDALEIYLRRYECGCLLITHDMNVAYRLSNRIIQLAHGRIVGTAVREEE